MLTNLATLGLWQTIQPQTILLKIDLSQQAAFEFLHLHKIHLAFEYRLLHALPGAFADLGYTPQASTACTCFSTDVVTNDYEHNAPYLMVKGR